MDFKLFSRNNTYVGIPGKLSEIYLHASLFSNQPGKVHFLLKSMGQICLMDLSSWIGEQQYIKMDFRRFSRNNRYVSIPGKLSENHLNAWLFSNPRGKVQINVGISCSPDLRVQLKYIQSLSWENMFLMKYTDEVDEKSCLGYMTVYARSVDS